MPLVLSGILAITLNTFSLSKYPVTIEKEKGERSVTYVVEHRPNTGPQGYVVVSAAILFLWFLTPQGGVFADNAWHVYPALQISFILVFGSIPAYLLIRNEPAPVWWYNNVWLYQLASFLILIANNLLYLYIFIELHAYIWLLLLLLQTNSLAAKKAHPSFAIMLFNQLLLNFLTSFCFFYLVLYFIYVFETTQYSIIPLLPAKIVWGRYAALVVGFWFTVALKIGQGPWFFWSVYTYCKLIRRDLVVYTLLYFSAVLPALYTVLLLFGAWQPLLLLLVSSVLWVFMYSQVFYKAWTVTTWALASSYINYLYSMFIILLCIYYF